jgi:hypothetical protein
MNQNQISYIVTPAGLSVFCRSTSKVILLTSDDPRYSEVKKIVAEGGSEEQLEAALNKQVFSTPEDVTNYASGDLEIKDGVCYVDGEEAPPGVALLAKRNIREGYGTDSVVLFARNLLKNPSNSVYQNLASFLEKGNNPITPDGHFLAYKAVRKDFKDIFSGTFDNSPGMTVEVRRNQVDEDRNRTCSFGLHVCSFDYLPYFAHDDGHVVVCKVHPADVVAIPADYNNTKMRVCRYVVESEYEGYYSEKRDILGEGPSVRLDIDSPAFTVRCIHSGGEVEEIGFETLSDAAAEAENLLEDENVELVEVINNITGAVIYDKYNDNYVGDECFADDFDDTSDTPSPDDGEANAFRVCVPGANPGDYIQLRGGFSKLSEALSWAVECAESEPRLVVLNKAGAVVRSLTS